MNIDKISFRTRARTIDHLGREQIADCPTAVSELWKNSYDAYAKEVGLHIFDGDVAVAALVDDGHGMNKDEFINKWLVVGTESKIVSKEISAEDRNGLPYRARQGQKGIGRLSCANLGSLLLLVSKRKDQLFSAALIDWRIFENPFLMLQDIEIPVVEFIDTSDLIPHIPLMFDTLMGNLWGTGKKEDDLRDKRILSAWESFELVEKQENKPSTKLAIENIIISASFEERHFLSWKVWTGDSSQGTAMFIANISDDLTAQLSIESKSTLPDATVRSQDRLFQTLSNFIDPFVRPDENPNYNYFSTSVTAWNGLLNRPILDQDRTFRIENLDNLEHIIEGIVNSEGLFKGNIKSFGVWSKDPIIIQSPENFKSRIDTACGPFHIRIGTFEKDFIKTTHTKEEHIYFHEQALLYSGFMVHRDGLRVMPYGREDNDYFEIEKRRTQHAGRYFWSNRNLFGRVLITRDENQNLKDKAGREGLIDNRASKRFRSLVENILIETGKKYFGTDSSERKRVMPDIKAQRAQEKAEQDQKKITSIERKKFKEKLKNNKIPLDEFFIELEKLSNELIEYKIESLDLAIMETLKERATVFLDRIKDLSLSPVPSYLGSLEETYRIYRTKEKKAQALLSETNSSINIALDKLAPKSPRDIANSQFQRNAAQLHNRIRKWATDGRALLASEVTRFNNLVDERNKAFHAVAFSIVEDIENSKIELGAALHKIDLEYQKQYNENYDIFSPYITILNGIREQVDYENVLSHTIKESTRLRDEVERLHSLAQLGITVEIIGHEIEALDMTISSGLRALPESAKNTSAFTTITTAQQALSDRWRFLSPLKLSGEKFRTEISGNSIFEYVKNFFGDSLQHSEIKFEATEKFKEFSVYEQPSRIYPVFINLVNNARYWVTQGSEPERKILLDIEDGKIFISNNGPSIDEDDIEKLFTLFFTKKQRGGRGIGLYLCRTTLLAGGHSISYEKNTLRKSMNANFTISFKGAKNV